MAHVVDSLVIHLGVTSSLGLLWLVRVDSPLYSLLLVPYSVSLVNIHLSDLLFTENYYLCVFFCVTSVFTEIMSKHIEVSSSSGEVSLPINSATKAEHLIKSQSVYFGHMQSTSLPAASDGPDDIDEVNPAGSEKTVATDIGSA